MSGLLTGEGNHEVSFSPDKKFFADTWSKVDAAPVSVLRNAADGKIIMEIEKADISKLLSTGIRLPEPFVAKGRDGVTDIWGIIVRPTNFDPSRKYPVIENIYAGPHSSFVPKSFRGVASGMHQLAELGFIVVQIDGMGTSNRSKAFHDVCWKNIKDAGFPDRILVDQGRCRKISLHGYNKGRYLRHIGRRAECSRSCPFSPRILQSCRCRMRMPRQQDGQDVVERAMDGMACR